MDGSARLAVFKALGDNTRYAIYLELARARAPRSTSDIAETLGLHANTVRPHLERMREVGLLVVEADGRGSVGRPQHRYTLAPDAPSLGLEPPAFPLLASMLAQLAATAGLSAEEATAAGAVQGAMLAADDPDATVPAAGRASRRACVEAVTAMMADVGFDPAVVDAGDRAVIAFTHCPYRELAETHPEVVCHLHRGMVEGFVGQLGEAVVERFRTLTDRDPCQVELSFR